MDYEQYQPILEELGVESPEKLKEIFQSAKERDALLAEKTAYEQKISSFEQEKGSLSQELEKYKTSLDQRFASPVVQMLNQKMLDGASVREVQTILEIASMDTTSIDPVKAKLLRLQHESGLTADDAQNYLKYELGILDKEDDNYDEVSYQKSMLKLKLEQAENRKFLDNLKSQFTSSDTQKQREAEAQSVRGLIEKANQVLPEFQSFGGLDISLSDTEKFQMAIREDFRNEIPSIATEYIKQYKIDVSTKEGKAKVAEHLERSYYYLHGPTIAKEIAKHAASTAARSRLFNQSSAPIPVYKTQETGFISKPRK